MLEQLIALNGLCRRHKISFSNLTLACAIAKKGAMNMTDAARLTKTTTAAATGNADALAKEGLVQRDSLVDDRRVVILAPTQKTMDLAGAVDDVMKIDKA